MKTLILAIYPARYRMELFNLLRQDIDVDVFFISLTAKERADKFFQEGHYLSLSEEQDKVVYQSALSNIKQYDFVILYDSMNAESLKLIRVCNKNNIPYVINCDGGFISHNFIKTLVKKYIIANASLCFASGQMAKKYLIHYGAKEQNIVFHNFTSLRQKDIVNGAVDSAEKTRLKEALGIPYAKVVLNVGQFIQRKAIDILLLASKGISDNIGYYFVGGKPTQEYLDIIENNQLKNIHFIDFIEPKYLRQYYLASDLFVLPTRTDVWGLVINEAMACGLPCITTDMCIAGIEMIQNGVNGYVLPVDDVQAFHDTIKALINDEEKLSSMSQACLKAIASYTLENVATSHIQNLKAKFGDKND